MGTKQGIMQRLNTFWNVFLEDQKFCLLIEDFPEDLVERMSKFKLVGSEVNEKREFPFYLFFEFEDDDFTIELNTSENWNYYKGYDICGLTTMLGRYPHEKHQLLFQKLMKKLSQELRANFKSYM